MEEKKIGDVAFLSYAKTDEGLGGNHETYTCIINLSESEYAGASITACIDSDENETMTDKELSVFKRVVKTLEPIE